MLLRELGRFSSIRLSVRMQAESGGWCPKGRKAEDGPIDAKYPFKESSSASCRPSGMSAIAMRPFYRCPSVGFAERRAVLSSETEPVSSDRLWVPAAILHALARHSAFFVDLRANFGSHINR